MLRKYNAAMFAGQFVDRQWLSSAYSLSICGAQRLLVHIIQTTLLSILTQPTVVVIISTVLMSSDNTDICNRPSPSPSLSLSHTHTHTL